MADAADPHGLGATLGKTMGIAVYCGVDQATIDELARRSGRAIDAKFTGPARGQALRAYIEESHLYAKTGPGAHQSCREARREIERSLILLREYGY